MKTPVLQSEHRAVLIGMNYEPDRGARSAEFDIAGNGRLELPLTEEKMNELMGVVGPSAFKGGMAPELWLDITIRKRFGGRAR